MFQNNINVYRVIWRETIDKGVNNKNNNLGLIDIEEDRGKLIYQDFYKTTFAFKNRYFGYFFMGFGIVASIIILTAIYQISYWNHYLYVTIILYILLIIMLIVSILGTLRSYYNSHFKLYENGIVIHGRRSIFISEAKKHLFILEI